jgi:hypothetical protein
MTGEGPGNANGHSGHFMLARWIIGVVGAGILLNTMVGVIRERLTWSVEWVGERTVVLTGGREIGLGAAYSGALAAVLISAALAPRWFRRPLVALVALLIVLGAMLGLDYLG